MTFLERVGHDFRKLRVHFFLGPEEALQTLHPLEVGHDHAAGVRENVRNNERAAIFEFSQSIGVIGPLAPSEMIFAFTLRTFLAVITPSIAAGIRTSTGRARSSSFDNGFGFRDSPRGFGSGRSIQ